MKMLAQKKQLEQLESTISAEEKKKIEDLITKLEEAIQKEDYTSMKEGTENLKKSMMEAGEQVYKNADGNQNAENDVIETDFSSEK